MKIIRLKSKWKHLVMFDFDDTLAHTTEATLVRDKKTDKIVDHLDGQKEFDNHTLEDGYYYDFKEFYNVSKQATHIKRTLNLIPLFQEQDDTKIIILTARQPEALPAVRAFLGKQGIDTKLISFFGSDGSKNKVGYLDKLIRRYSISSAVTIFEDNLNNIKDMIVLEYEHPDLSFDFVQVIDPDKCEDLEEAKKFNYPKGEYGTELYQRILKKIHPAMKRRLIGLGGNDYLGKGAKKLKDFSRGKSAPP